MITQLSTSTLTLVAKGYLEQAANVTNDYQVADIINMVNDHQLMLFGIYRDDKLVAVFTAKFERYPQADYLVVVHAAGVEVDTWIGELHQFVKTWAKDTGMTGIRLYGRKGWIKYFRTLDSANVILTETI